jgi:hypothetical protein
MKPIFSCMFLICIWCCSSVTYAQNFSKPQLVIEPTLLWSTQNGYIKQVDGRNQIDYDRIEAESVLFRSVQNDLTSRFSSAGMEVKDFFDVKKKEELQRNKRLAQGGQVSDYALVAGGPVIDYSIRFDFPSAPTADGSKVGFEFISMPYSIVEMATDEKIAVGTVRTNSTPRGYYDLEKLILNCIEIEFPNIESQIRRAKEKRSEEGRQTRVEFTIDGDFDMYEICGDTYLGELISNYMTEISFNSQSNPESSDDFFLSFNPQIPPDVEQIKPWLMGKADKSLIVLLKQCKVQPQISNRGNILDVKIKRTNE